MGHDSFFRMVMGLPRSNPIKEEPAESFLAYIDVSNLNTDRLACHVGDTAQVAFEMLKSMVAGRHTDADKIAATLKHPDTLQELHKKTVASKKCGNALHFYTGMGIANPEAFHMEICKHTINLMDTVWRDYEQHKPQHVKDGNRFARYYQKHVENFLNKNEFDSRVTIATANKLKSNAIPVGKASLLPPNSVRPPATRPPGTKPKLVAIAPPTNDTELITPGKAMLIPLDEDDTTQEEVAEVPVVKSGRPSLVPIGATRGVKIVLVGEGHEVFRLQSMEMLRTYLKRTDIQVKKDTDYVYFAPSNEAMDGLRISLKREISTTVAGMIVCAHLSTEKDADKGSYCYQTLIGQQVVIEDATITWPKLDKPGLPHRDMLKYQSYSVEGFNIKLVEQYNILPGKPVAMPVVFPPAEEEEADHDDGTDDGSYEM